MSLNAAQKKADVAGYLIDLADAARERWNATRDVEDADEVIVYAAAAERLLRDAGLEVKVP